VSHDSPAARRTRLERRRILVSIAAAAIVIGVGVVALSSALQAAPFRSPTGSLGSSPDDAPGGWTRLPNPPLSARQSATAVWVGSMVVIVGGDDAPPCPANADCAMPGRPLSDGARYDPATGGWTPIARAPIPIGQAEVAVVGDLAFLWVQAPDAAAPTFLSYDVGDDAWTVLALPPKVPRSSVRLVATSDSVIAYPPTNELGDRGDQVYDVAGGSWHELPAAPLTPSFDRTLVVAGGRLIELSVELLPDPGVRPPIYRAAVLDLGTGEWRRLRDAPIVGYESSWFVAGGLVVNPSLGGADGGQTNNWGRTFPYGGMLDLEGEAWVGLPNPPREGQSFGGNPVGGGDIVVNRQGWALDLTRLAWLRVNSPAGGPEAGAATTWTGDRLVLFGGTRSIGNAGELLGSAWQWRPGPS
jgi:hypothetical protein